MRVYRMLLMSLLAVLWLAAAGRAIAPPSLSFLQRPVIVPIEIIRSGHIALYAKVNGKGPYRFIFDTGSPMLVISEQVARDSGVLPRHFDRPWFTPLGNLGEYKINTLSLGRAAQPNLLTNVWNHPTVEILSRSFGRFEGLIGFPFFAHYQITIDYKSKTLSLVPSPYEPADTQKKMTDALTEERPARVWAPAEMLGITIIKAAGDEAAGVTIATVRPNSPAADAGLKANDRLLTIGSRWTDSIDDCYAAVTGIDSAQSVAVNLLRNGKPISVQVAVQPGI